MDLETKPLQNIDGVSETVLVLVVYFDKPLPLFSPLG
jgi:hypothetical protein